MKVKPEIKEKIITTANALTSEGIENPTNDQVRERMGGGSLSHISPVMREWRESRKAEVATVLEMPADLKKTIETSVSQVWTAASKLASSTVDAIREEANNAVQAATGERDEALAEVSKLEERIAELNKSLADRDSAVESARSEMEVLKGDVSRINSEKAGLAAKLEDRDQHINDIKRELKEAREDNKKLQGDLVEIARKVSAKK